jgi:hypothetical protein
MRSRIRDGFSSEISRARDSFYAKSILPYCRYCSYFGRSDRGP